jgi:hypothetical protein
MAQGLVQQDCTAVVAMQFPISDGAATTFTGEFYGALADGFPVDQAATSARKALIAEYAAEWATPVLFLRSPDGRVFDHIVAQPTLTAVPTPPPAVEPEDEERAQQALATDAATTQTKRKTADEQPAAAPSESDPMRGLAAAAGAAAASARIPTPSTPAASAPPASASGPSSPPPTQPVAVQPTQLVPQQPTTQQPAAQQPTIQRQAPPQQTQPQQARPQQAQPQQPTYQQAYQPPPSYQTRPQTQPPQPPPGPAAPRYAGGPTGKKPRWGLIITVILAVVAVVFGGLYWYGRSLPETVDPTNNNGGQATTLTGPKISAVHLSTGLTINGDPSDWPSDVPTFDSNVLIAGNDTGLLGHWGLAWDDTNLYFIVKVTDPTALQTHQSDTSQLFKGDGVNFEFGTAQPKNKNASLETGDKHVLLGPANFQDDSVISAINVPNGSVFARGSNTIQGLHAATAKVDDGYLLEAAIPWSTLGAENVSGGNEYGMNLNVSDAVPSGTKAGELSSFVSNNPARKGNDAQFRSIWGTLQLEG